MNYVMQHSDHLAKVGRPTHGGLYRRQVVLV